MSRAEEQGLSALLAADPTLHFDLEFHLIGVRHGAELTARRARFDRWLAGAQPPPAAPPAALPFCGKEDLRRDPGRFAAPAGDHPNDDPHDDPHVWGEASSGTSGKPVTVRYSTGYFLDRLYLTVYRIAALNGRAEAARARFQCISLSDGRHRRNQVWVAPDGRLGMVLRRVIDEARPDTVAQVFDLIAAVEVGFLTLMPRHLQLLLAHPGAGRLPLAGGLIVSGAVLAPALRARAETVFGVPVIEAYGMTELGLLAAACPAGAGLHVFEDRAHLWVAGEDGRALPEGATGQLIGSSFDNAQARLSNYRTGDVARLIAAPCGCGLPGARLTGIEGRRSEMFRLAGGVQVSPKRFMDLLDWPGIADFRIRQTAANRLLVEVEPAQEGGTEALLVAVAERLRGELPDRVELSVTAARLTGIEGFQRFAPLPADPGMAAGACETDVDQA